MRLTYKGKMAELRKERGNRCMLGLSECTVTTSLEFAHVESTGLNGRGRGLPQRYHDIKRNPSAYILACRSCHLKADSLAVQFQKYDLREKAPF